MAIKYGDVGPDDCRRPEREDIHLALLREAVAGLQDVRDGRVATVREVLAKYRTTG